jgi:sporulation protein YlmC with PRC-barrel domain
MSDCISLTLGARTLCSDGACGEVTRIVLDSRARVVSHVVVEPKHRQGLGRLVSLALIDCFSASIVLNCTSDEFDSLARAEETQLLPGTGGRAAYVAGRPLSQPYEGLVDVIGEVPQPVTYDSIPRGKVELRGDELVRATDGEFGKVRGLVIDRSSGDVVSLIVHEHHSWLHEDVVVPIEDVRAIADEIRLDTAKRDVQKTAARTPHVARGMSERASAAPRKSHQGERRAP